MSPRLSPTGNALWTPAIRVLEAHTRRNGASGGRNGGWETSPCLLRTQGSGKSCGSTECPSPSIPTRSTDPDKASKRRSFRAAARNERRCWFVRRRASLPSFVAVERLSRILLTKSERFTPPTLHLIACFLPLWDGPPLFPGIGYDACA